MSVLHFLTMTSVAALAVGLAACQPEAEADPRQADRMVQIVSGRPANAGQNTYTGLVAARVQSDLGFRVQGKIIQRLVDAGQVVKAGQPLMRIDPVDLHLAITAQAQQVAAARARAIQAAADEERYSRLVATNIVSHQTYDQAKAAADSARALLSAAEAQETEARNQGDYSLLLADADGTVVDTLAEPGQVVAQGQIVVRLAHAGPREASINLPETRRPKLGSTARAELYNGTTLVSATLRQLSDAADPRTRTYEARYVLDGEGAGAPLGATVRLTIEDAALNRDVQIPLGAIDDEGKGTGVWVFNDETSTVSYRSVRVGHFGNDTAIVSDGLKQGERVVASGGHFLHDGEHVRTQDSKAAMQ